MSYIDQDSQRIEKSRHARFTLTGVIAAKTPESGKKTHDALQKICACIIEAYKVANDGNKTTNDKRTAIRSVTGLVSEIEWLSEFVHQETDFCKFYPEIHSKLHQLAVTVSNEVKVLKADFAALQQDIESFPDVFDNLLHLLENMTEFMKLCHAAEVCRVIEFGKNAYNEAFNLLHLEVKQNFVPQAQLCSQRSKDFLNSTVNLVKIQEGTNQDLEGRVENVEKIIQHTMPNFILASKEYLLNNDPQLKEAQKHAHDDVTGCYDELNKILERIKVKYTNAFDEDAVRVNPNLSPLEKSVNEVMQAVAKLRSLPPEFPEPEKKIIQEGVPKATKAALVEFDNSHATPDDKQELVRCVKQARDGPVSDFFQAQEAIGNLADRVHANQQYVPSITLEIPVETFDEGPKDLLEAAKALCASMKTLNITLDE